MLGPGPNLSRLAATQIPGTNVSNAVVAAAVANLTSRGMSTMYTGNSSSVFDVMALNETNDDLFW